MVALLCFLPDAVRLAVRSKSRLEPENAALRHQLTVLRRKVRGRVQLTNDDRLFLIQLRIELAPGCLNSFSAAISGASAEVSLPSGEAAA